MSTFQNLGSGDEIPLNIDFDNGGAISTLYSTTLTTIPSTNTDSVFQKHTAVTTTISTITDRNNSIVISNALTVIICVASVAFCCILAALFFHK